MGWKKKKNWVRSTVIDEDFHGLDGIGIAGEPKCGDSMNFGGSVLHVHAEGQKVRDAIVRIGFGRHMEQGELCSRAPLIKEKGKIHESREENRSNTTLFNLNVKKRL